MKYSILDLGNISANQEALVSNCYRLWFEVYEPILKASSEAIHPDYFYRCKTLSVLHEGENPIAFSLHNNMHLSLAGVSDHSYFAPAPIEIVKKLKADREHILTIEWVTVNPNERGKFTKIQPVDLIMGLCFKAAIASHYTAVMGFSRVDLKADRIAAKYGPRPLAEVTRHDITCKVMFARTSELTNHPLSKVQEMVDALWASKSNHSPYIHEVISLDDFRRKKAA